MKTKIFAEWIRLFSRLSRNMAKALGHRLEKLQGLRGMVDLLPDQTALWQEIEATARNHFQRASISEIRTPLLEATELFSRGIGESTDVVGKEMYSFSDRSNRHCTLRPEGTASVVRALIQHGLINQGAQRFWYSGPMFRYERPQAGRQRQFHQIGIEFLGFTDPRSDVEAISIAWDLLRKLQINDLTVEINTLGNNEDRLIYRQDLVKWLEEHRDQLDKDSKNRLATNPLRILDSKDPLTQNLLKDAPTLSESLAPESVKRFEMVQMGLSDLGIPFHINPLLVRGLDYYSHTAFEIKSDQLGAQSTICGGGRYDGLVEQLGGAATPAIGWAIGMERLVLLLSKTDSLKPREGPEIYVVNRGEQAEAFALIIGRKLRQNDKAVEIDLTGAAFSKQLKRADRSGARWAIVIGDQEAHENEITLKDLRSKAQDVSKEERINLETLLMRFA